MKLMFSPSPFVFSFILIEIFHSAHAAEKIFTIDTSAPTSEGAFGEIFISQTYRDEMVKPNTNEEKPGNSVFKKFTLEPSMKYFDDDGRSEQQLIYVHYNGLISLDPGSATSLAGNDFQTRPTSQTNNNFMAIFWQQYTSGNVYSFVHRSNDNGPKTLSPENLEVIAADLNKAFGEDANNDHNVRTSGQVNLQLRAVKANYIKDVYVFTWLRMAHKTNPRNDRLKSTFQALLIRARNATGPDDQWYLKTYLASLNSNGNTGEGLTNDGQTKTAQIGIAIRSTQLREESVDFAETFGNELPTIFELVSNEYNYQNQSSYSFDLNADAINQPIPPIVKCSNGNCAKTQAGQAGFLASRGELLAPDQDFPDSKQTKEDLRKFCLFRDSGEYPLPANCDFFIYCTHGQGIFAFCPNGTKFNPVFLTCDYPVNHECKFDSLTELQTLVKQPPSQSNNLCFFKGFGEVVDPLSCDHYYACTNTRSIRMACPAGLHFRPINAEKGICDYPRNVKCSGDGVRPNDDMSVVTTQSTTTTTPVTETTKYHPKNIH